MDKISYREDSCVAQAQNLLCRVMTATPLKLPIKNNIYKTLLAQACKTTRHSCLDSPIRHAGLVQNTPSMKNSILNSLLALLALTFPLTFSILTLHFLQKGHVL